MTEMEHQMRMMIACMNMGQKVTMVVLMRIHTEPNAHIAIQRRMNQNQIDIGIVIAVVNDSTIVIKPKMGITAV